MFSYPNLPQGWPTPTDTSLTMGEKIELVKAAAELSKVHGWAIEHSLKLLVRLLNEPGIFDPK